MIILISLISVLVTALIIVIKAADLFVDNLVEIGESIGISQIVLGVTASAIGTSLPEFGSAMIATLSGSSDMGVGCVIGSNIWNIAGILGISAAFAGVIKTDPKGLNRDGIITLVTALILIFFMFFGYIGQIAAVSFIMVYLFYLRVLIKSQKEEAIINSQNETEKSGIRIKNASFLSKLKLISIKTYLFTVIGLVGLIVGCKLLVYSGVGIGKALGIPEMIMGLFTLAVGTSIPEFVVTFSSAMKGLHDLSIGTVLGSNTFNIMIGIGLPALFMNILVEPLSFMFDAPVMIFITILALLLIKRGMKLTRIDGIILTTIYVAYAVIRIGFLA